MRPELMRLDKSIVRCGRTAISHISRVSDLERFEDIDAY